MTIVSKQSRHHPWQSLHDSFMYRRCRPYRHQPQPHVHSNFCIFLPRGIECVSISSGNLPFSTKVLRSYRHCQLESLAISSTEEPLTASGTGQRYHVKDIQRLGRRLIAVLPQTRPPSAKSFCPRSFTTIVLWAAPSTSPRRRVET